MKKYKVSSVDMEIALMRYFDIRKHLIVPNVWWGMGFRHECDLLVMTKSNYATEVEIKISKADLKKDADKPHQHKSKKIKKLYFAIPDFLEDCIEFIPEHAGIILVGKTGRCNKIREAKINCNYKFSDKERCKLAELGCMRILSLKENIIKLKRKFLTFKTQSGIL